MGCCDDRVLLYAFDLLELDGEDFRPQPLHERKAPLEKLARILGIDVPATLIAQADEVIE